MLRLCLIPLLLLAGCSKSSGTPSDSNKQFTIAVIPDTQNYIDYRHQTNQGFAIDAQDLFLAQMRDIAARQDVAFVASVGDVWQHSSKWVDPAHEQRGVGRLPNPFLEKAAGLEPTPETHRVEIPGAIEGYRILKEAGLPFGVAPGNHDYDAFWSAESFPINTDKDAAERNIHEGDWGMIHVGGLDNFRSVFGADSEFFKDKPWYVDHYRGGANSAQVFEAGGYRFLHIALEMGPGDSVLDWASGVIRKHPGYPTIITTHAYLNRKAERFESKVLELAAADPADNNTAQQLWDKFLSQHDQIFLLLCGHYFGQSHRIDLNRSGKKVYQILADYQTRRQVVMDAGNGVDPNPERAGGIGDGWYRLMRFDLSTEPPQLHIQTWSSHYRRLASEIDTYADWYRNKEQPGMSDADFVAADEYVLVLDDFRERFGR